jgi:signal peptidase I
MSKKSYVIGVVGLIIALLMLIQPYKLVAVVGKSMEPTYHSGNILVAKKSNDYKVGDVVVLKNDHEEVIIKRITMIGGQQYYNVLNVESAEIDLLYGPNLVRYMTDSEYSKNKYFILKVPINSFYVLGDNWYNSDDSRRFGCVNKEDILFKVIN